MLSDPFSKGLLFVAIGREVAGNDGSEVALGVREFSITRTSERRFTVARFGDHRDSRRSGTLECAGRTHGRRIVSSYLRSRQ